MPVRPRLAGPLVVGALASAVRGETLADPDAPLDLAIVAADPETTDPLADDQLGTALKVGLRTLAALLWVVSVGAQTVLPPKAAPPEADPKAIAGMIEKALQLASAERAAGHLAQAEVQLRFAADRFKSVRALLQLAEVQLQQENRAGALASLRQARALAPNSEDVLGAYAEALLASGTPDAAIPVLSALTRICPTVARYQYMAGTALLQAGDAAAAAASLREAARLEPDQAPTLIALGQALNGQGLYSEAKPHLLRGLSLTPDSAEVSAALAESEAGLGELGDAEEHARRVLARSGADATANFALGMVLMKREKFAEARDALLKAAAADLSSPKVHEQLSLVFEHLDDAVSSQKERALYDQKSKEESERVKQIRRMTGFSVDGAQP